MFRPFINPFFVRFKSVLTKIQPPVFPWASYPNTLGPAEEMYWRPLGLQVLSEATQNVQDSLSNNETHISGELSGTPEEYREADGEAGGDDGLCWFPCWVNSRGPSGGRMSCWLCHAMSMKTCISPAKKENGKFYACQTEDYNLGTAPQKVRRTIPLITRQGTVMEVF